MANVDDRVRKLELTFAKLAGGAAVVVVVVLGFFGFASLYQIPHEVERQIPDAVAKEIKEQYPNIGEELGQKMAALAQSEGRARTAADRLETLAASYGPRLASLEIAVKAKRIHDFGYIDCGKTKSLTAPNGTTDEWILFSVNPHISAEENSLTGDNALYSFATTIIPQADGLTWSVNFSAEVNYNTTSKAKKRTIEDCNWNKWKWRPKVQILALRKA